MYVCMYVCIGLSCYVLTYFDETERLHLSISRTGTPFRCVPVHFEHCIRPMLINSSNFSFAGMVGDLALSLGGTKNTFCRTKFPNDFFKEKNRFNAPKFLMTFLVIDGILWMLTVK